MYFKIATTNYNKFFIKKALLLFVFSLFFVSYTFSQSYISNPVPTIVDPNTIGPSGNFLDYPVISGTQTQEVTIGCGQTSVDVLAQFTDIGSTDSYQVESIPYSPVRFGYEPSLPGAVITVTQDDSFSPIYTMDDGSGSLFDLCFFQNVFNQFIINDNGVITFDPALLPTLGGSAVGGDPSTGGWRLFYSAAEAAVMGVNAGDPIKLGTNGNQFLLPNSIYLPGHDLYTTNLATNSPGSEFYWNIYGTAPNRRVVFGLYQIPMYGCFGVKQTHEIIFYETTNIIEVHIQNIDICSTWNPGGGVGYTLIGVQNGTKDVSAVAPGRDTDSWSASNEAWRFIPNGGVIRPTFTWFENYDYATNTGTFLSNNPAITFSPATTTTYTAEVRYIEACSGNLIISTRDFTVNVAPGITGEIDEFVPTPNPTETVYLCPGDGYTMNFTVNTTIANPNITYAWYKSPNTDVSIPANVISTTSSFTIPPGTLDETIAHLYGVVVTLHNPDGTTCDISDEVEIRFEATPSFNYPANSYCTGDTNPVPTNIIPPLDQTTNPDPFSIDNGGVINAATGEINLSATGLGTDTSGNFTITYTTRCGNTAVFPLTIIAGDATFSYPSATVCINDATITPDVIAQPGGTFSIDNGGVIDVATGVVDLTTSGMGTDGTGAFIITYQVGSAPCLDSTTFNLTISAQDATVFGYVGADPNADGVEDFCKNDTNPLPSPAPATSGGTYTINGGGTIDPVTGEIDLTLTPASGTPYTITYTTLGSCANSSTFDIVIHPNESSSFSYNNTYCSNATNPTPTNVGTGGGTYTITLSNGTPGGVIDSGTGVIDLTLTPVGDYIVTYVTPGIFCPDSSTYNISILVSPDITPPTNTTEIVCDSFTLPVISGTNLTGNEAYYTGTGGTGVSYNAGDVLNYDSTATYPITLYLYNVTNSVPACLDEESFQLTINPLPVAPTTIDVTECEQNPIQTLTATATVPAGSSVVWYDVATGGNVVVTPTLNAIGTVTYYAESVDNTTACVSSTRTPIVLTINPAPTAPTGTDIAECEQSPIQTLTATAVSPAGTSIVWYDAATGGNVVVSPTLNAVGTITYFAESVDNTTNCISFSRTPVTLTIVTVPNPPTATDITECEQSPLQTLTATATVPGGASIVWYDAATGGNVVATPTLNIVGTITYYAETVVGTSGCISPTRTAVILTINPAPAAPTATDITECEQVPVQTLTATSTAPAGSSVVWYDAATGGNVVATPTLNAVGTITYYAESVDNTTSCTSLSRTPVVLTINPIPVAPTATDITECEQTPLQTLTATATAPAGSSIVWYDAATGGNVVATPTLNVVGTITYYAESVENTTFCTSLSRTAVTLTIDPAPATPTATDITECEQTPLQTLTATATAPAGSAVVWYDAATGGNVVATPTLNAVGTITYYAESVDNTTSCTSLSRTPVVLTINPIPATPTATDVTECEQTPLQTLTATAIAPAGSSVVWYDAATGGNVVATPTLNAVGTITYYAESIENTTSCISLNRLAVTLTINPAPAAPTATDVTECEQTPLQTLTATATAPAGSSIVWYDAATGGNVVATPTLNAVGTITYYAESVDDTTGCISDIRTPVILTINPNPIATAPTSNLNACDDGTGNASFDTSLLDSEILNGQSPTEFIVTYYDENGNQLNITTPQFVYSFDTGVSELIVTARVTNILTDCFAEVDFTFIKDDPDNSEFIYGSDHYCIVGDNPFPEFPNPDDFIFGGTFSILTDAGVDDGAQINPNTGELLIDTGSFTAGTTYVITYDTTGAFTSLCPTQSTFNVAIDAEVFADISYPNSTVCIDEDNPQVIYNANTLLGGTFTVDNGASINPQTGEFDLTSTEGGVTYTISYTTPNTSACTDTKTFQITVIGLPEFELPLQAFLCPNQDFITLQVENPQDTYQYEWVNAEDPSVVIGTGESFDAPAVGIYAVTATEQVNLCTSTQIIQVGLADQVIIANVAVNDFNRPNNSITIQVEGGTGDFIYYLIDQNGYEIVQVNDPVFNNLEPNIYTIRVEDNQGCSVTIEQTSIAILDYPRFFTPNGDGYYEYWQIQDANLIPNSKIYIFDRFGRVLAQIEPNGLGWDGTYLGKPVPATDYWFKAQYMDPNTNLPQEVKGHFSIIRKKPTN